MTSIVALKNDAKVDIKIFWSSLNLLDFFIFPKTFLVKIIVLNFLNDTEKHCFGRKEKKYNKRTNFKPPAKAFSINKKIKEEMSVGILQRRYIKQKTITQKQLEKKLGLHTLNP